MWPWGHAAAGYLCYTLYRHQRYRLQPHGTAVVALVIGTQLPDLIDKTFAWQFDILPNGRSLGHSLFAAALLLFVVWAVAARMDRRGVAAAFGIGYVTHLIGDALYPALSGEFATLRFLGWPVLAPLEYETVSGGFLAHLLALEIGPHQAVETPLAIVALALWYRHGMPGLDAVRPGRSSDAETTRRPEP